MFIKDSKGKGSAYIENLLKRAKESQKDLNAVVTFCEVKKQMEEVSTLSHKPLFQVPIFLKDNVSTKGVRTTASSRILDNYVPSFDATVTKKLREAGAIILGKTSMDELGMGGTNLNAYTGRTHNPWDVSRITGGSSGGSAALVAAGIVPIAIGTDTGDSVRKPAAYCGIVGLKPTYGRISRYGIIPYASSMDHVGIFATSVHDAALSLEVLAGRDDKDMTSSFEEVIEYTKHIDSNLQGKRIGIIKNVYDAIKDIEIKRQFDALVFSMKKQGACVEFVEFDKKLMEALLPTYYIIANAEATTNHANLDGVRFGVREAGDNLEAMMINSRTKGFSSEVRKRFVIGSYSLFVDNQEKIFKKAQKVRRLIVEALTDVLKDYDALIASASGSIAPKPDDSVEDKLSDTYLIAENHMLLGNFSGFPSICVPNGFVDSLPIGVSVLTKAFAETTLFDIAKAIEDISALEGNCTEVTP